MNLRKVFVGLCLALIQYGFSQADSTVNMLFIGNSLTFSNNLPQLVQAKAKKGGKIIKTKMIAYPNYGLEDHWNDGKIQQLIKTNKYDFVIIQQGPSSQTYGRTSLIMYGAKLKKICRQNNSQLVYFMVWPSRQYYHTFDGVIENYTEAAEKNDALLCAVGQNWKAHFDATNDFSYYEADGFHPSLKGSKVAAEIIAKILTSD